MCQVGGMIAFRFRENCALQHVPSKKRGPASRRAGLTRALAPIGRHSGAPDRHPHQRGSVDSANGLSPRVNPHPQARRHQADSAGVDAR
jgi:hypothetical protein